MLSVKGGRLLQTAVISGDLAVFLRMPSRRGHGIPAELSPLPDLEKFKKIYPMVLDAGGMRRYDIPLMEGSSFGRDAGQSTGEILP